MRSSGVTWEAAQRPYPARLPPATWQLRDGLAELRWRSPQFGALVVDDSAVELELLMHESVAVPGLGAQVSQVVDGVDAGRNVLHERVVERDCQRPCALPRQKSDCCHGQADEDDGDQPPDWRLNGRPWDVPVPPEPRSEAGED